MAKQRTRENEIDYTPKLLMPKAVVIQKICDKIDAIKDLMYKTRKSMEFGMWRRETETLLIHAFGAKSKQVHDFNNIPYFPVIFSLSRYGEQDDYHASYLMGLQKAQECLLAIANEVKEYYPDAVGTGSEDAGDKTPVMHDDRTARVESRKVFVVHGHDEGMKMSVARFLEKLDLQPVILHEQPNGGNTIIEKFEANADVAFAVVLMSPDDEGHEKGSSQPLTDRARQNVVLELGYFIGRLGRSRVCALQSNSIEIPSDVLGILYVPYDQNGGWKIQLVKELREAKIELNAEKITTAMVG